MKSKAYALAALLCCACLAGCAAMPGQSYKQQEIGTVNTIDTAQILKIEPAKIESHGNMKGGAVVGSLVGLLAGGPIGAAVGGLAGSYGGSKVNTHENGENLTLLVPDSNPQEISVIEPQSLVERLKLKAGQKIWISRNMNSGRIRIRTAKTAVARERLEAAFNQEMGVASRR